MEQIFWGLICFFATTLGAMSGIGGGVIIKPTFDILFSMPSAVIGFLSGITVLSMSTTSLIMSRKSPIKLDFKISTILAAGSVVGGIAGKSIFTYVNALFESANGLSAIQNAIIAVLTVGSGLYVIFKDKVKSTNVNSTFLTIIIGFLLGASGSFLGIGGGPINLVVLYHFFSMDSKTAALNSLYVIMFSQASSLISTISTGTVPEFDVIGLIIMAACGVVGGVFGRKLASRLSTHASDKIFIGMLVLIVSISVVNVVRFI